MMMRWPLGEIISWVIIALFIALMAWKLGEAVVGSAANNPSPTAVSATWTVPHQLPLTARDGRAPTATPTVPPVTPLWPVHRALTLEEVLSLARYAGFPEWTVIDAAVVAWCESKFEPGATGAEGERGIWQIHPVHPEYNNDEIYTPLRNARAALDISSGGTDWSPWTCQP